VIDKNESLDRQLEGKEIRGKEEEHTNLWGGNAWRSPARTRAGAAGRGSLPSSPLPDPWPHGEGGSGVDAGASPTARREPGTGKGGARVLAGHAARGSLSFLRRREATGGRRGLGLRATGRDGLGLSAAGGRRNDARPARLEVAVDDRQVRWVSSCESKRWARMAMTRRLEKKMVGLHFFVFFFGEKKVWARCGEKLCRPITAPCTVL